MYPLNETSDATVLVVDDDRRVRSLLTRWLADWGYACLEAADVAEARRCLNTHDVDLMTLDVTMPGTTGLEFAPQVKQGFPDVQILMLTAAGDAGSAIRALHEGANAYLLKPVQRAELRHHVEHGLERRRLLVESRRHTEELERKVREQTLVIRQAHEETIYRLVTASGYRDEETGGHVRRTGLFSEVLARAAGWSDAEADAIRLAAPMHDVGKIGIPDHILRKPGRLTADEYEVMKRHTLIGAAMLAGSSSSLLGLAAEIARYHHERWDGKGYPHGLAGEAIPASARILAIVDVYDALTHDRVYRPALPVDKSLTIMAEGLGTQFDPLLLPVFFTMHDTIERISQSVPDAVSADGSSPATTGQEPCLTTVLDAAFTG